MVVVRLPRSLVALFPDPPPRRMELEAATLGQLVEQLDERWPGMRDRLCEPDQRLREHINVFVDREPAVLEASLEGASEVYVVPAVSGG